jgi:hypothetical protein
VKLFITVDWLWAKERNIAGTGSFGKLTCAADAHFSIRAKVVF